MPTLGAVTALAYLQSVLGGMVSASHAGLACPDWPTCFGRWFPPLEGLAGLQMLHRFGGYVLTASMMATVVATRTNPDAAVRAGARVALGLTLGQVILGVCNVLLGTPPWISALHIATAAALLAMLVTVTYRVATAVAPAPRLVAAPAS
jgi:cytochrome c oxidase assembly protein subunit 15